jgi:hypothetical protein
MSPSPSDDRASWRPSPEEASARLEDAEGDDDETRLEVLEDLHAALQEELDSGETPSAGR